MTHTHSPAPWKLTTTVSGRPLVCSADLLDVATIGKVGSETEQHANAALISAAPDLLAALETMLAYWDKGSFHPAIDQACAAIARAKGQA